jgi:hypothetical protein
MSEDRQVVIINAELQHSALFAGLLSIHSSTRYRLSEPIEIDLYADAESDLVARVRLSAEFTGDRHGYIPDTILQIV